MSPHTDQIPTLVHAMATSLDADRLVAGVTDIILRGIRELDGDEVMQRLLRASVSANVHAILDMLADDRPVQEIEPTPDAVAYALRLAQHGVPGNALVRAYTLGKDWFVQQLIEEVQALGCPPAAQFAVVQTMSAAAGDYIDWMSQLVYEVYERERDRWLRVEGTVRATVIHDVLTNGTTNGRDFFAATGYRLTGHHLGLVVWADESNNSPEDHRRLNAAAARFGALLGSSGQPLVTAVDVSTAWAWLPMPASSTGSPVLSPTVAEEHGVRVALGLVGHGLEGFRHSHFQATAARSVAAASGRSVVGYGDEGVALTAMLSADLPALRSWVHAVLGPLAQDTESVQVLRETLRVFFACRESPSETAAAMNLHRNSVRYRLGRAAELTSGWVTPARADLATALNVCHYIGSAVLAREESES